MPSMKLGRMTARTATAYLPTPHVTSPLHWDGGIFYSSHLRRMCDLYFSQARLGGGQVRRRDDCHGCGPNRHLDISARLRSSRLDAAWNRTSVYTRWHTFANCNAHRLRTDKELSHRVASIHSLPACCIGLVVGSKAGNHKCWCAFQRCGT